MQLSQRGELLEQIKITYYHLLKAFETHVGMSQECLQVLGALSASTRSSQIVLQQDLKMDRASVNRHVKRLERMRLVSRLRDPTDNRVSQVSITQAGYHRLPDLQRKRDEFEEVVMVGLEDSELAVLQRCLERIRLNMVEHSRVDDIPLNDGPPSIIPLDDDGFYGELPF